MSTFLEIMGTLTLRDTPEVWMILARLEQSLFADYNSSGLNMDVSAEGQIKATFDYAGECSGTAVTTIENDLDTLSADTVEANYLTIGWDNIRDRQFFGPPDEVRQLKSQLALVEIQRLQADLVPADRHLAAERLLAVSE